jgi:type I restriction enzyme S subunit
MTANGWPIVSLGELLTLERRPVKVDPKAQYAEIGIYSFGRGIFHKEPRSGLEVGDKDLFLIKEGDFIFQITFAWEGAVGLASAAEDGMYGSVRFPTFRVDEKRCYPPFLFQYFLTHEGREQLIKISPGSAGRNRVLSLKRIPEVFVSLPALSEQQRIVARIEELAAKIKEARGLRRQAVEEAKVLVNASARRLLSGVNVEETELHHWLAPNRDGIQTGPFGAQLGTHDFVDLGIPLLTIGNVQYGGLELSDLKYVSEDKAKQLGRFVAREGDILFARMGTVGRCCVVPQEADGWLFNYHIIRVALDKSRVTPRYIHWTIRASPDVESYLSGTIRGATRQGVNSKIVGALPCRVPAMSEQRRIVAYLDELQAKADAVRQLQAETSAELEALLPSVLDRAFKGEL